MKQWPLAVIPIRCESGHPMGPRNIGIHHYTTGGRFAECLACLRIKGVAARARNKALNLVTKDRGVTRKYVRTLGLGRLQHGKSY